MQGNNHSQSTYTVLGAVSNPGRTVWVLRNNTLSKELGPLQILVWEASQYPSVRDAQRYPFLLCSLPNAKSSGLQLNCSRLTVPPGGCFREREAPPFPLFPGTLDRRTWRRGRCEVTAGFSDCSHLAVSCITSWTTHGSRPPSTLPFFIACLDFSCDTGTAPIILAYPGKSPSS